jgi:hypothetical protein
MRNANVALVGKFNGKRLLERSRCRCENKIKIDLKEKASDGVNWNVLDQDRIYWGEGGGSCEDDKEVSVPLQPETFCNKLCYYHLLKKSLLHAVSTLIFMTVLPSACNIT